MSELQDRVREALADRYGIERVLGEGGMSTVFLAKDLRHDRAVAIKVMKIDLAPRHGAERFLREIRLTARLVHPHILPLHDSGEAGGLIYYVTPYIDGESLRGRLHREAGLPVAESLRLAREIAGALDYAHRAGVIHRDLKPENILIQDGHAIVADFGLARAMTQAGSLRITSTGDVMGTPGYMSPEQVQGRAELDERSDLYSLGCVLFEMLAGEPPFTGDSPTAVMYRHVWGAVPDVAERCPEVPEPVAALIRRLLAKSPSDRPESAAEVRSELDPWVDRPSPSAEPRDAPVEEPTSTRPLTSLLTRFIGRSNELRGCARLLERARVLTLTGIGGVGKTRLAVRLAEKVAQAYPGGIRLVDLGPLHTAGRVPHFIAAALEVKAPRGSTLIDAMVRRLQGAPALLLLDNCEHVREGCAPLVAELVRRCAGLKVLATSREALGLEGELVFAVPPLSIPLADGPADAEAIGQSEGVQLFVDRATYADPGFRLTAENAATVADVCRRLDGLPLALEIIAARLRLLSLDEVSRGLDRALWLDAKAPAGSRSQSVAAAIEWSYEHLNEVERAWYEGLSVFSGGWTLTSAAAVCGAGADEMAALQVLTQLADKSLIVVNRVVGGDTRYRYLEIVRQHARQRLAASGHEDATRAAFAGYCVTLAEAGEARLWGPEQALWFRRLEAEHVNLLSAIEWSVEDGARAEMGLRLAGALYRFWYNRGHFELGHETLLRVLQAPGAATMSEARARALFGAAGMTVYRGDYVAARRMYEEGLAYFRAIGNRRASARWLVGLGVSEVDMGDYAAAESHYRESLDIYSQEGESRALPLVLDNLAIVARCRGDLALARSRSEEALAAARASGDRVMEATVLVSLASVSAAKRDWPAARGELRESLRLVQEMDLRRVGLDAIDCTASLAFGMDDGPRAARLFAAAGGLRDVWGLSLEPPDDARHDAEVKALEGRMSAASYRRESERGRSLAYEEAIRDALKWLQSDEAETRAETGVSPRR